MDHPLRIVAIVKWSQPEPRRQGECCRRTSQTEARIIRKEETSLEKMLLKDPDIRHFLNYWLMKKDPDKGSWVL